MGPVRALRFRLAGSPVSSQRTAAMAENHPALHPDVSHELPLEESPAS
jgi:hypothetical protein